MTKNKFYKEKDNNMHLAVIYAKPRGLPLANTYVEEISQKNWPVFPWDEEDKANHYLLLKNLVEP